MIELLNLIISKLFAGFKASHGFNRVEQAIYDKKCSRCGTTRSIEYDHCPRCHGKTEEELIDIHISQAYEQGHNIKIGIVFLVISVLVASLMIILFSNPT